MATLHYHHTLVTKVFTSWKQWLCGCQEVRSREQMRQQQQHRMATLLARVTAACQHDVERVCQHDPSTVEKKFQHDTSMVEKECQHDPSIVMKECDLSVAKDNTSIKKRHHLTDSSCVAKECHSQCHHDPSTLGIKGQPTCHHNPPILKKKNTTAGLITSKLVRKELVS